MFPQRSKVGQWVVGAIVVIFVLKNPTIAAHDVKHAFDALSAFADGLH